MKRTYHRDHTSAGEQLTHLMLATFRLNGRLLAAGDRLVAPLGLTSARWQVMGAVALAGAPQPVAHIARQMGLTRQAVQRVVDDLADRGLVAFAPNPHHRRAKLVALTAPGRAAYDAAIAAHVVWSNRLAEGLAPADVARAIALVEAVAARLAADDRDD